MKTEISQLSKKDLLEKMKGQPSTNRWDVVCSYTIKKINALLSDKYEQGGLVNEIPMKTEWSDIFGTQFALEGTMHLACPNLSFTGDDQNKCLLSMPIGANFTVSQTFNSGHVETIEQDIPMGDYFLDCAVPLASLTGAVVDGEFVPEKLEDQKVIVFEEDKEMNSHVVLNFENSLNTIWKIVRNEEKQGGLTILDDLIARTTIEQAVANYFKENVGLIQYALAGLNNRVDTDAKNILKPKSFVFAVQGAEENGTLSLYIQTANSGNSPGNATPKFQPGDEQLLPVPEGYSSSIIIANDLLKKSIAHAVTEEGYQAILSDFGVTVSSDSTVELVNMKKVHNTFLVNENVSMTDVKVDFEQNPFQIEVEGLSVKWKFQQTVNSKRYVSSAMSVSNYTNYYGRFLFKVNVDQSFEGSINDYVLKTNIDVSKDDYNCSYVNETNDIHIGFWEGLQNKHESKGMVESYFKAFKDSLIAVLPELKLDIISMDFFATTNLLLPGEKVISFSNDEKAEFPYDATLFGEVIV